MNVLLTCLLISILMPFLAKVPLAIAMQREGRYDNAYPRAQQQRLEGFGARANAAHYNCFEALACFAPSVLVVLVTQSITTIALTCAVTFVAARVGYIVCYLANLHTLRSVCWGVAMVANIMLFLQAF